ncbi:hypothetical protein LTS08_006006 [Lithohypha guttulata]|uniref:uncharacterized protein n=1 Tax=Lithohypha guttulata TaxID=1690604 RepID=UPI002DDE6FC4|nr:hypothetical protein LTR51_002520 [Lithohypha guttulata]KAK5099424.1 hypothetical protein LTS08_006006 [Lithohypha guttulata]
MLQGFEWYVKKDEQHWRRLNGQLEKLSAIGVISIFNTPLQTKFHQFAVGEQTDLRTVLDNTWLSIQPDQAVTYVMNHDTQEGQVLSMLIVEGWFIPLAYALILLREAGYPCIFYADLYGQHNGFGDLTAPSYAKQIADLAMARKYFAYGTQTDYFNDANAIGWARQGSSDHPEGLAVVMSNAQGGISTLTMNVGVHHAGETWSGLFGGEGAGTIAEDGSADFVAGAAKADAGQRAAFDSWDVDI